MYGTVSQLTLAYMQSLALHQSVLPSVALVIIHSECMGANICDSVKLVDLA